jgi:TPR repeat protein
MRSASGLCLVGFVLSLGVSSLASAGQVTETAIDAMRNNCTAAREGWLQMAEKGDAVAQFKMGLVYEIGGDFDFGCGPHDYFTAFQWFKRAAEGGMPEAEAEVASFYLGGFSGSGVSPDYSAAMRWFRRAADDGNLYANYRIGLMYQLGTGVPQDYEEAARWFRRGAERGDFNAQLELGHVYEIGQGVPKDNVEAHMWWNLAAAQERLSAIVIPGVRSVAGLRDELASKMTPAEVAEAQKRAREWKPMR